MGEGGGDDEEVLGQLGERGVATDGSGGADVDEPEERARQFARPAWSSAWLTDSADARTAPSTPPGE